MKHTSIPMNTPCEIIKVTPVNPLISKCQIKVCYVGEKPNRNGSVITKEVAEDLANSLPGSPIVGYFDRDTQDFEEHSRDIEIIDGELQFVDKTKPYGFVDLGAKVWFQKFLDDGTMEHEYLMTEGYIWTGQYPEAQRIVEQGNNQSMELDEKSINAHWARIDNEGPEFFIINEAIISKLCVLGEEYEPCFEGSTITKVQFSLSEDFKQSVYSMTEQMKEILKNGGTTNMEDQVLEGIEIEEEVLDTVEEEVVETTEENVENEDKTVEYNLEENQEYIELKNKYSQLESNYDAVLSQIEDLKAENKSLKEFKVQAERVEKQQLIDSFSMLSEDEKLDVITKIDEYSLDEIEAKLSIIYARKNKNNEPLVCGNEETVDTYSYNINNSEFTDNTPAWVKAVKEIQKNM